MDNFLNLVELFDICEYQSENYPSFFDLIKLYDGQREYDPEFDDEYFYFKGYSYSKYDDDNCWPPKTGFY
jgi:hypothetical protein